MDAGGEGNTEYETVPVSTDVGFASSFGVFSADIESVEERRLWIELEPVGESSAVPVVVDKRRL